MAHPPIDRRQALRTLGLLGLGGLAVACGSDGGSPSDGGSLGGDGGSAGAASTSRPRTSATTSGGQTATGGWAVGGTELITVAPPGDDVFEGTACAGALGAETTEGPCYYADETGGDISAGLQGLPMQLCLRVVDADCRPLAGHTVEVWHTDPRGVYSGDASESADARRFDEDFCTVGDASARDSTWCRGQLVTDDRGRADFVTCFPGWYPIRAIHIHLVVSDPSGQRRLVSQVCFTDELARDICTTHPLYADRGEQAVTLDDDGVFPSSGIEEFLLSTERNPDGTLLAYKDLQVA